MAQWCLGNVVDNEVGEEGWVDRVQGKLTHHGWVMDNATPPSPRRYHGNQIWWGDLGDVSVMMMEWCIMGNTGIYCPCVSGEKCLSFLRPPLLTVVFSFGMGAHMPYRQGHLVPRVFLSTRWVSTFSYCHRNRTTWTWLHTGHQPFWLSCNGVIEGWSHGFFYFDLKGATRYFSQKPRLRPSCCLVLPYVMWRAGGLSEGDGYLLSVVEGDPGIYGLQSFYYINIWLHRVIKKEKRIKHTVTVLPNSLLFCC